MEEVRRVGVLCAELCRCGLPPVRLLRSASRRTVSRARFFGRRLAGRKKDVDVGDSWVCVVFVCAPWWPVANPLVSGSSLWMFRGRPSSVLTEHSSFSGCFPLEYPRDVFSFFGQRLSVENASMCVDSCRWLGGGARHVRVGNPQEGPVLLGSLRGCCRNKSLHTRDIVRSWRAEVFVRAPSYAVAKKLPCGLCHGRVPTLMFVLVTSWGVQI